MIAHRCCPALPAAAFAYSCTLVSPHLAELPRYLRQPLPLDWAAMVYTPGFTADTSQTAGVVASMRTLEADDPVAQAAFLAGTRYPWHLHNTNNVEKVSILQRRLLKHASALGQRLRLLLTPHHRCFYGLTRASCHRSGSRSGWSRGRLRRALCQQH